MKKKLIVVGDRVLIKPEEGEERSKVGLYLPPTAVDSHAVQGGKIVATVPASRCLTRQSSATSLGRPVHGS
jgi:co-chaperonin GroES (HSP10)